MDAVTPGVTLGTLYSSGVGINKTKQHGPSSVSPEYQLMFSETLTLPLALMISITRRTRINALARMFLHSDAIIVCPLRLRTRLCLWAGSGINVDTALAVLAPRQ